MHHLASKAYQSEAAQSCCESRTRTVQVLHAMLVARRCGLADIPLRLATRVHREFLCQIELPGLHSLDIDSR